MNGQTTNHDDVASVMTTKMLESNCQISSPSDVPWHEYNIHQIENDHDVEHDEHEQSVFDIFQVAEPLDVVDFNFANLPTIQVQCQENYTQSTGMAIWLGAEVLASWLVQQQNPNLVQGKKVLEVGAGAGLCGIVTFHLKASKVVMTDGDLHVLTNLRYNVQHNNIANNNRDEGCTCQQLIWGQNVQEFLELHGQFDIILGSDLFYMTKSLKPLFSTVDQLLAPQGIFLVCSTCANQHPMEHILKIAEELGFSGTEEAPNIYKFRRKEEQCNTNDHVS